MNKVALIWLKLSLVKHELTTMTRLTKTSKHFINQLNGMYILGQTTESTYPG